MSDYNFNEKMEEYSSRQGRAIPVWQSPKYKESKDKAIEILDSGKYGVKSSDFWILMNETKSGNMAYTGLIISHNGCLKINDALESKFDPSCVSLDKEGFGNSLVYSYCNKEQGIYEVGEVSKNNCKNDYPYAMAYKRLFDRVVLKLSKLAYAGIYSDSEAEEFKDPQTGAEEETKKTIEGKDAKEWLKERMVKPADVCEECGAKIKPYPDGCGKTVSVKKHIDGSKEKFGKCLCLACIQKAAKVE